MLFIYLHIPIVFPAMHLVLKIQGRFSSLVIDRKIYKSLNYKVF